VNDVDFHANWTIVLAALIYLIYNIQVVQDPNQFGSNYLYRIGDYFYFINSILYLISALRDYGWFWFVNKNNTYGTNEQQLFDEKLMFYQNENEEMKHTIANGTQQKQKNKNFIENIDVENKMNFSFKNKTCDSSTDDSINDNNNKNNNNNNNFNNSNHQDDYLRN
jgi:hypothetical protein